MPGVGLQAIVEGSCLSALGKKWHPHHFTCYVCDVRCLSVQAECGWLHLNTKPWRQVLIDVGSPVYVHNGLPYCPKDFPEGDGEDVECEDEQKTRTEAAASTLALPLARTIN